MALKALPIKEKDILDLIKLKSFALKNIKGIKWQVIYIRYPRMDLYPE